MTTIAQCQHALRATGGSVFPCHRVTAHDDGWHEHIVNSPATRTELVDVDGRLRELPVEASLVLRWAPRGTDDR